MNVALRHFSDIRVTATGFPCAKNPCGSGQHRIVIEYRDEAGEAQSVTAFGYHADRLKADLDKHAAVGVQTHLSFLMGYLRSADRHRVT